MANPEHLEIVKRGAEAIRKWRKRNPDVRLDLYRAEIFGVNLTEVNLGEANLGEANLGEADLRAANLRGANLTEANLGGANLIGADLGGANLTAANLGGANLIGADLGGADLTEANLGGANLHGANLDRANLDQIRAIFTAFDDVDLSTVKSLDTVVHAGPSTIGIDTLYKSKGKIPKAFLRGCGVPDELVTYLPSLIGAPEPIQFYSCFISYSHTDEEFAKLLYSRMQDEHLRVWYAPEDIKGGRKLHEQIEGAIQKHDKLLLVLSETSMKSEWVATEIYHARQREVREKRQVLFPIRLVPFEAIREWKCFDADTGKDMAREIREYFIPDFSNWKNHDSFEAGFKRLLEDLKADESK